MEDLPSELLYTIFEKQLISIDYLSDGDYNWMQVTDYDAILSLATVCLSWQSTVKSFYLKLKPMMPPLILLTHSSHCYLFNNVSEELHAIHVPKLYRRWVSSCSNGWMLTISYDFPNQIHLLNPFSKAQIRLPPIWNRLEGLEEGVEELKMTLSRSPLDPNCAVLVRHSNDSKLALLRQGDKTWTRLRPAQSRYSSVAFYKNEFYLIDYGSDDVIRLFSCFDEGHLVSITEKSIQKPGGCSSVSTYLVESHGELLLILKFNYSDNIKPSGIDSKYAYSCWPNITIFEIYKLQNRQWMQVKDVGENTIYLSSNFSVSIPATCLDERLDNRIYFIDDSDKHSSGYITGVYHIKNEYVELAFQSSPPWTSPQSWFTPEFRC